MSVSAGGAGPLPLNASWLRELSAQASQPPRRPRQPLWAGAAQIGSVEPEFLNQIELRPSKDGRKQLLKEERAGVAGWSVQGDVTATLNQLAQTLHKTGLAGAWRDEQLAVLDEAGLRIATIERAAVRPLGIATHAVHLLGQTEDGHFWVQQRALDKANDPGLWDTLMGGMVPAEDTLEQALQRETWEEAGLHLAQLQGLRAGGRLLTSRPSTDGQGAGYLIERIDWYHCTVPATLTPVNQDGEVVQFALMDRAELVAALQAGRFTLEAALVFAALGRP